jgi:hypothetical protein
MEAWLLAHCTWLVDWTFIMDGGEGKYRDPLALSSHTHTHAGFVCATGKERHALIRMIEDINNNNDGN